MFDPAQMGGEWIIAGYYPTDFERGCEELTLRIGADALSRRCTVAGQVLRQDDAALRGHAVARYETRLAGVGATRLWILWTDESYLTAVVGGPDGGFGWVLNRDPTISADRGIAAQRILDFNGYDPAALVRTGQ